MANQRDIKGAKIPDDMDVAAIRLNTTCPGHWRPYTQENFGRLLGVPTGTLRQWEQGRRKLTGAARVLLSLTQRNARLVIAKLRALPNCGCSSAAEVEHFCGEAGCTPCDAGKSGVVWG